MTDVMDPLRVELVEQGLASWNSSEQLATFVRAKQAEALQARLDAMTTEYGHRWGTGDITNHGTDREQAEEMTRRGRAYNHGPGVKFATTHALMARQVTGWVEIEEVGDGV